MKRRGPASILLLGPILLTQALPASAARAGSAPAGPEFPLKSARLVVIEAGNSGPVTLGFQVELEPGWHLYWVNPGDAGLAPNARWTLPEGFTAGPLRHPVPKKAAQDGIVSLEHENPVLLLCDVSPPPSGWPGGPWKAAAVLEWMACSDSCLTGETPLETAVPPDAASLAEGRALFERAAPRFPRPFSSSGLTAGPARAEWTGSAWRVEVPLAGPGASEASEFFAHPIEDFVVDNASVSCRGGKIVVPLVPSRGPGSPPPRAVGGVLVVAGAGYEISVAVPRQTAGRSAVSRPVESRLSHHSLPGLIPIASWR